MTLSNPDSFTIIGREDHGLARTIKEFTYIKSQQLHTQQECRYVQPTPYMEQSPI